MTSDLRQCEILAQKLYDDCRKSTTLYHSLASSLRRLRNILGDLDEIWHDDTIDGRSEASRCISQCADVLEKLSVALPSRVFSEQHEVHAHVVAFEARVMDLALDLMTAYERLTNTSETTLDQESTAGSPAPACAPRPCPSAYDSRSASLEASRGDLELTDYGHDSDGDALRSNNFTFGNDVSNWNISLAEHTEADTRHVSSDNHRVEASAAGLEQTGRATEFESVHQPALLNCAAAHKMMVQELQKKLGSKSNTPQDVPSNEALSLKALHEEGIEVTDYGTKAQSPGNTATNCEISRCRSAAPLIKKTPPPVPPKRLIRPACPKRDPPPPPPDSHQCRTSERRASSAVNIPMPSPTSTKGSSEDLYCASPIKMDLTYLHAGSAVPPTTLLNQKRLDPTVPVNGRPQTTSGSKNFLDMEFGDPPDLDLTLIVGHTGAMAHEVMPPSRPAKAKAMAMDSRLDAQPSSSANTLRRYRPREAVPSSHQPNIPLSQTLPSRWRGIGNMKVRRVSSPCSTVPESLISHPTRNGVADDSLADSRQSKDHYPPTSNDIYSETHASSIITNTDRPHRGYYAPEVDLTPSSLLDHERIQHIVNFWNNSWWDLAENYLRGFHATLLERLDYKVARRVHHLIAVCASLRGDWDEAIRRFIACLRTPIRSLSDLDDGDCAASYWLGDLYAIQNRRADANVAYALAERSSLAGANHRYMPNLRAERDAVQSWTNEKTETRQHAGVSPSMLDSNLISAEVADFCVERARTDEAKVSLDQRHNRSSCVRNGSCFGTARFTSEHKPMAISPGSFHADAPWPMPYDPLFVMASVHQGRLLSHEGHILIVPNTTSDLKLPRLLSVHTLDCFSCGDLAWLISTLRLCLEEFEIEHAEVVDSDGIRFCCRYSFMQQRIATTHYFSIALLRHPLWPGHYVADIRAEDDMCSSRLIEATAKSQKGVKLGEARKMGKMIKRFLDKAAKEREEV